MPSSAWPPRLTSSTQPFLGSFAEKGLGAKDYPKYIYYPLLSNFGWIIIFGNGMQMLSCSSSLPLPPPHQVSLCSFFWLPRAPSLPLQVITQLQNHLHPFSASSLIPIAAGFFLAKIDRRIHTEILPTGKGISWQAVHPLGDLVYLSLKWQNLDWLTLRMFSSIMF